LAGVGLSTCSFPYRERISAPGPDHLAAHPGNGEPGVASTRPLGRGQAPAPHCERWPFMVQDADSCPEMQGFAKCRLRLPSGQIVVGNQLIEDVELALLGEREVAERVVCRGRLGKAS